MILKLIALVTGGSSEAHSKALPQLTGNCVNISGGQANGKEGLSHGWVFWGRRGVIQKVRNPKCLILHRPGKI